MDKHLAKRKKGKERESPFQKVAPGVRHFILPEGWIGLKNGGSSPGALEKTASLRRKRKVKTEDETG